MGRKEKPLIDDVKTFVRWHLGRDCFSPHTGQDWPAWCAFVHLAQCWTRGGGETAIAAMQQTLLCAQPIHSVLRTFIQVIPAVGDWCHIVQLWPRVTEPLHERELLIAERTGHAPHDSRIMKAWERDVQYDAKHKPIPGSDRITLHGWDPHRELARPKLSVVP